MKNAIIETVETVLTYGDLAELVYKRGERKWPESHFKFRRVIPLAFEEYLTSKPGNEYYVMAGITAEELPNVSQTFALPFVGEKDRFALVNVNTCTPNERRGKFPNHSGPVYKIFGVEYLMNGTGRPFGVYTTEKNGIWIDDQGEIGEEPGRIVQVARGYEFNKPFDWFVDLHWSDRTSVRIPTDPTGIVAAFSDRPLAEGKNRRDALIHFVSGHYRKKRNDPDALTWVRKHVRGKQEFVYGGIKCMVTVPAAERAGL